MGDELGWREHRAVRVFKRTYGEGRMISYEEYIHVLRSKSCQWNPFEMEVDLNNYRKGTEKWPLDKRLEWGVPFKNHVTLFGNYLPSYPCKALGKYIVMHIVDSLIECAQHEILFRRFNNDMS